jgi:hypothetical protein
MMCRTRRHKKFRRGERTDNAADASLIMIDGGEPMCLSLIKGQYSRSGFDDIPASNGTAFQNIYI